MEYSSSFTAGGILFNEFEAILPYIQQENIKEILTEEAKKNEVLRITTESARKRVVTELKKRIGAVDSGFWNHYQNCSVGEKKYLLFYLCVQTYQLIKDFHFKITIPGYWSYRQRLDIFEYKMYLDELSARDKDVDQWSDSTRRKCITNYVRMLSEAGLTAGDLLLKPRLDYTFFCYFLRQGQNWVMDLFLSSDREKTEIIKDCQ